MCRSEEREIERETEEERVKKGLLCVKKVEVKERAVSHSKLRIGLLQKGSLPKQHYFLSIFAHTHRFPPPSLSSLITHSHTLSLSYTHALYLTLIQYPHTHSRDLSLSHTHTHTLINSHTHSPNALHSISPNTHTHSPTLKKHRVQTPAHTFQGMISRD